MKSSRGQFYTWIDLSITVLMRHHVRSTLCIWDGTSYVVHIAYITDTSSEWISSNQQRLPPEAEDTNYLLAWPRYLAILLPRGTIWSNWLDLSSVLEFILQHLMGGGYLPWFMFMMQITQCFFVSHFDSLSTQEQWLFYHCISQKGM